MNTRPIPVMETSTEVLALLMRKVDELSTRVDELEARSGVEEEQLLAGIEKEFAV